jgi:hypothetical protein
LVVGKRNWFRDQGRINMPLFNFSRRPNVQELKSQGDMDGLIEALSYEDDHNIRLAAASAL